MKTRRNFLIASAAAALGPFVPAGTSAAEVVSKPVLSEEGLYHFDWYLESFLDLKEDVETAAGKGRRLAAIWSQKGCIYCERMAKEHFVDPQIAGYVRKHFDVLHLNMFGDREITDFDGKKYGEKAYARANGIRLTPTIQFFTDVTDGLDKLPQAKREVARMPGLLEPKRFLAMFRYVQEKGYEKAPFSQWLKKA